MLKSSTLLGFLEKAWLILSFISLFMAGYKWLFKNSQHEAIYGFLVSGICFVMFIIKRKFKQYLASKEK